MDLGDLLEAALFARDPATGTVRLLGRTTHRPTVAGLQRQLVEEVGGQPRLRLVADDDGDPPDAA